MTASFCALIAAVPWGGSCSAITSSTQRELRPAYARTGLAARKLRNARRSLSLPDDSMFFLSLQDGISDFNSVFEGNRMPAAGLWEGREFALGRSGGGGVRRA